MVLYEYSTNEVLKFFLKFESLYSELNSLVRKKTIPPKQSIRLIIILMQLVDRADIKAKIKLLLKKLLAMQSLKHPTITAETVHKHLNRLFSNIDIHEHTYVSALLTDPFLKELYVHQTLLKNVCPVQLPIYNLWLNLEPKIHAYYIKKVHKHLAWIDQTTRLILFIIRSQEDFQLLSAQDNLYHQYYDSQQSIQLVRVHVAAHVYPHISANSKKLIIRFILNQFDLYQPSKRMLENNIISFHLARCVISTCKYN
jgi:cell division FtsZ-interacting protein ZapD